MSTIKRKNGAPVVDPATVAVWTALGVIAGTVGSTWAGLKVAAFMGGASAPSDPFKTTFGLLDDLRNDGSGRGAGAFVQWSDTATVVAVLVAALYLAGVVWVTIKVRNRGKSGARVDRAARHMGRNSQIAALTSGAVKKAARLGIAGEPGLVIGRLVDVTGPKGLLYQDWESCSVDIAGARAGKTTSRVIPAVVSAPGAVVATSNKRDLVDATRGPRAAKGRVWVFDPQGLVDEPATWWWNPLTYVTDDARAKTLASVFSAATTKAGAKTDAYFDTASINLLANFLLAAAVGDRPITQVYRWLSNSNDRQAADLLEAAGFELQAVSVRGVVSLNEKQRGGIYGGAIEKVAFLANRDAAAWVTRPAAGGRAEFRPDAFARSTDTLYSLSKEGAGSAGPLVTALTVAVCEAAEDYAVESGGRLRVPLVAVLDEAANVCRWPALPDLYSHYGSRGINVMTFLQSWSQGVEVWGADGMRKLWSAANVNVYMGGVKETGYLEDLSKLIGTVQQIDTSVSFGAKTGGRGQSHSYRDVPILDVADLASLDPERLIVFAAGAVPTVAKQTRWYEGPHAPAIEASLEAHDPARIARRSASTTPQLADAPVPATSANPWVP